MIAEFSIVPIGKGVSLSDYVADCLRIVDESGLDYKVNPMGTVVEGELDEVMEVIVRCHRAVLERCERVETLIKIDDRKSVKGAILSKIESLERKIGKELRK